MEIGLDQQSTLIGANANFFPNRVTEHPAWVSGAGGCPTGYGVATLAGPWCTRRQWHPLTTECAASRLPVA